jgi:hypothetical protein
MHHFFITVRGYISRGPLFTQKGDAVCIFLGGKVPFILRKSGPYYYLLGESCKLSFAMKPYDLSSL